MQITDTPLEALHSDTRNARRHDERNMQAIIDSLTQFGQVEPLVVRRGLGRVVGGNGRLEAMRKMGWTSAKVVEVDLDDQQATALAIALNRSGELGSWNLDQLEKNLVELRGTDLDLTSLGFDEHELSRIIQEMPQVPQDAVAPVPEGEWVEEEDGENEPSEAASGQAERAVSRDTGLERTAPDPARQPSAGQSLRPIALAYHPEDAEAFFRIAEEAEAKLGTHGLSDTCLAALRQVCGQSVLAVEGG